MAGAQLLKIIYVDNPEVDVPVLVSIGDTVRAQDWAKTEYPDDLKLQDERAGLYAVYLGAKRAGLEGTKDGWLEWLDIVTIPDDEAEEKSEEKSEPGES